MPLKIQMFSDFICPFCYIGFEVVRKLKPEFDIELEWRGFEIHPEWPLEGMPAERFYQSRGPQWREAVWRNIDAMAAEIQLPMKAPSILSNSRLALEVAEFAIESRLGEAYEERVYRAYFQEGANIGDPAVVKALAREAGIDSAALEEALHSRKYELKLKNSVMAAHSRDVTGVPTFFIGEFPLVGAQSVDVMRRVLKRAVERLGTA